MSVRRAKIESVADLEALPEDEWVFVPGGIQVDFEYEGFRVEGQSLRIRLPQSVARRFRPRRGARLTARISRGELIVEEAR
jgi:hypothetical protein